MKKIKTKEDLFQLYERNKTLLALRTADERVKEDVEKAKKNKTQREILVCGDTGCASAKSKVIFNYLKKEIENRGLDDKIKVIQTGCFGLCEKGPVLMSFPEENFYVEFKLEYIKNFVEEHLINGKDLDRLYFTDPITKRKILKRDEIPFYKKQFKIALRNVGVIDPSQLDEYIAVKGYQALAKCLSMSPMDVINIIKKSGLRGRGGGGFPTGIKWEVCNKMPGDDKFIICNADEGDPGAFMDRSILEGDPFSVLEAMAIGGYAIGANKGVIYIRAEYPSAITRLQVAIKQLRERELLGKNILGSDFSFDIELKYGAGAFVCGEETALIASVQGRRGEPTTKPPFPAEKGLWGKPTVVNNVETFANIPPIILNGAEWFASIGTEKSKGTKVFALAGKINYGGLIEVPMGTTLREIIYDIGGGLKNGKQLKAVQTGGPSGGCIPAEYIDTPITYESLTEIGSMMGSGGMIVIDEDNCMVDVAKYYLEFTTHESCGKCAPCRIGTKRMHEILTQITEGYAEDDAIEKLENLGKVIKNASLCGLGQTAPNPVLSTIRFFRNEYENHIKNKKCKAGVCKNLFIYRINDNCTGCLVCFKNCPAGAIIGAPRQKHIINFEKCTKCGICFMKCRFNAIEVV
jgi:NADH:ubiquinone oxidoreductase subunit F (NADH-binding)/(2Fe-2S) ferredoxin